MSHPRRFPLAVPASVDNSYTAIMDKKQLAVDYYRKGVAAMGTENWNLAAEMFGMCAKFAPDNVGYRQLLLKCEKQRDKKK
jgi:hypothetical protein